jgi:hypothetical protein
VLRRPSAAAAGGKKKKKRAKKRKFAKDKGEAENSDTDSDAEREDMELFWEGKHRPCVREALVVEKWTMTRKEAKRRVCVAVHGVVWCGVVWCGVVWCGVVWCGVVWCGVVCAVCAVCAGFGGACAWLCVSLCVHLDLNVPVTLYRARVQEVEDKEIYDLRVRLRELITEYTNTIQGRKRVLAERDRRERESHNAVDVQKAQVRLCRRCRRCHRCRRCRRCRGIVMTLVHTRGYCQCVC